MFLVAYQQRRLHAVEGQALDGLLEQGVRAGEGEELLGELLAREGPKTRAAATGKNYWNHVGTPKAFMHLVGQLPRCGGLPAYPGRTIGPGGPLQNASS
ncbi:hypothetical protein D9M68_920380 [compost metagenome]